jgi:type II secretory pathway component PulC
MSPDVMGRALRWIAGLLAAATLAFAVYAAVAWMRLPQAPSDEPAGAPAWNTPAVPPEAAWKAFVRTATGQTREGGPAASRFRLAGTFFAFSESPTEDSGNRRAILDDLEKKSQALMSEGQEIDGFVVARIFQDHVVLRKGGMETEIWLGFSEGGEGIAAASTARAEETPNVLETSRFGDRVGTNRWVISRDSLLGYYRELLDDPERIAALYMSLKPDYKEDNAIGGYVLDVEGEGDFFKSIGLAEGDVIRKVNSMNMTSQKRAEYFIGEFVKNRVNAFVLDIEREGRKEKLIYMIR